MNKKIFAFDLDGTLLVNHDFISEENISALKEAKEKGHEIVVATGRPLKFIESIEHIAELFDFFICNNGTYIYNVPTKKFIIYGSIPKRVMKDMIKIGQENQAYFIIHTKDDTFQIFLNDSNELQWDLNLIGHQEWATTTVNDIDKILDILTQEDIMQASLVAPSAEIEYFKKYLLKFQEDVEICSTGVLYLDINSKGVSKLFALKELAKILKVDMKDTIAFGDSGNDLQMLEGAGVGVAMGNASPEAKEAADIIIGNNDTNAIAKKIEELI